MHEVLVNRLGGLSLPRKSVVRLTDRPDMTLDVYRGRKITKQKKKGRICNLLYSFLIMAYLFTYRVSYCGICNIFPVWLSQVCHCHAV